MNSKSLGNDGEDRAARYLTGAGWEVVARNFRRREGEIDLIARRGTTLAFVEVKTRRSEAFGSPAESITHKKAARIRLLARRFLLESHAVAAHVRFDVIEVLRVRGGGFRLTHIEDAF
jgi:putative endonuclease